MRSRQVADDMRDDNSALSRPAARTLRSLLVPEVTEGDAPAVGAREPGEVVSLNAVLADVRNEHGFPELSTAEVIRIPILVNTRALKVGDALFYEGEEKKEKQPTKGHSSITTTKALERTPKKS